MKHLSSLIGLLFFVVAANAQYSQPYRMAYDGQNYYITNKGGGTVTKLSANGTTSSIVKGLHSPNDIFYGNLAGNSVIVLLDSNTIKLYDSASFSSLLTIPITGAIDAHDGLFNPNNQNEFFISDRGANKIIKGSIGSAPFYPVTFSTLTSGIIRPAGMIVNADGKLIVVSDTIDGKVHEVDLSSGVKSTVLSSNLDNLNDVAQDAQGNYYLTNWGDNSLYRYSKNWTNRYTVSTYNNPSGLLAINEADFLGLCCSNCNKVEFRLFHLFSPTNDLSLCPGDSLTSSFIPSYRGIGTYDTSNYFTIEISDSNGNFFFGQEIGRIKTSTPPAQIMGKLPLANYADSGYSYRLVSTAPRVVSYFTKTVEIKRAPDVNHFSDDTYYSCVGTPLRIKHSYDSNNKFSFFPPAGISYLDSVTFSSSSTADTTLTYICQIVDTSSGCQVTDDFRLIFDSEITFPLLPDSIKLCEGDTATIITGNNGNRYAWAGSSDIKENSSPSIRFFGLENTILFISAIDSQGICSGFDSVKIQVNPSPKLSFTLQELEFCFGDTIDFSDYSDDSLNYSYSISNSEDYTNGKWLAKSAGRYSYTLYYSYISTGCKDSFGNGYGVSFIEDSIRLVNKGGYLESIVYADNRSNEISWYINGEWIAFAKDTLNTNRLNDGDSIQVSISSANGQCLKSSNVIVWKTLGVLKPEIRFDVFPNPSNGKLTIETEHQIQEVKIYSPLGKLVYHSYEAANKLETKLPNGLYLLEVKTSNGIGSQRIVIR